MHVVLCSTELLLDVRCLIAEHVYPDNRSLGLPFMEQVAAWVGGWGVGQIIFGSFLVLHWSAMSIVFSQSGIGKFAMWQ